MKSFFKHNFFPFSRFIVADHSMEPEYKPGDHVLTFNWGRLQSGDVVVFVNRSANLSFWGVKRLQNQYESKADSGQARMTNKGKPVYFIKRIDRINEAKVFVSGDNKHKTSLIDPIRQDQIIGVVILKY